MSSQLVATVGRVILGAYFLLGGLGKIFGTDGAGEIAHMTAQGIPYAEFMFPLSGACEIIGGLCLVIGLHTRFVSLLLAAFVILVSVTLHAFWKVGAGHEQFIQMVMFLKNMTTFAGLLAFVGFGSGPLAIDNFYDED